MFIVFLRFSDNKSAAGQLMEGHKAWIERGFADGVFLLVGSLQPDGGGAILAGGTSRSELEARVRADPFVVEDVVRAEIYELAPARAVPEIEPLLP